MQQLQFSGVDDSGASLVLVAGDGAEYVVPVDERLRAALRPTRRGGAAGQGSSSPREVQSLIRAGQSAEEVAELTGWSTERVARFESPILAEREHVAGQARRAHVRGRGPGGGIQSLEERVRERLAARGVDPDAALWDATRPEGGRWTVIVSFVAGQRSRRAAWRFEPPTDSVEALDDEARWLSEDELALPGGAASAALLGGGEGAQNVDLMTTMRERSRQRGRRRRPPAVGAVSVPETQTGATGDEAEVGVAVIAEGGQDGSTSGGSTDPAGIPGAATLPEDVLPLEDLHYDPATMGPPPGAQGDRTGLEPVEPADDADVEDAPTQEPGGRGRRRGQRGAVNATLDDFFGEEDDLDVDLDVVEDKDDDEQLPADGVEAHDREEHLDELTDLVQEPDADHEADHAVDAESVEDVEPAEDVEADVADAPAGDADVADVEDAEDSAKDSDEPDETPDRDPAAGQAPPPAEAAPDEAAKRKGRTSVPSWDDIMFGAKDRR